MERLLNSSSCLVNRQSDRSTSRGAHHRQPHCFFFDDILRNSSTECFQCKTSSCPAQHTRNQRHCTLLGRPWFEDHKTTHQGEGIRAFEDPIFCFLKLAGTKPHHTLTLISPLPPYLLFGTRLHHVDSSNGLYDIMFNQNMAANQNHTNWLSSRE